MQQGMPHKGAFYQRPFTSKENAFSDKDFNKEEENIFSLDKWNSRPHSCHYCCPLRLWDIRSYSNTVTGSFTEKRNRLNRFSREEILNMHLTQSHGKSKWLKDTVRPYKFICTFICEIQHSSSISYTHTCAHSHISTCTHTHTGPPLHILILPRIRDKSIPKHIFF